MKSSWHGLLCLVFMCLVNPLILLLCGSRPWRAVNERLLSFDGVERQEVVADATDGSQEPRDLKVKDMIETMK